jgi:hypothetical protein
VSTQLGESSLLQEKIKDEIQTIVSLACSKACLGYGGVLLLQLGISSKKDHEVLNKECEIRTNNASWRLIKGKNVVVGDYDDESCIKKELKSLVGSSIVEIKLEPMVTDIKMFFDDGLVLEIFGSSSNEYAWELSVHDGYIQALPTNVLRRIASNFTENMNSDEEAISSHSKACAARWEPQVSVSNTAKNCEECAYYRALQGQFHFWDYGLCTNSESRYDGKVVNIKSSCHSYNAELKAT